MTVDEVRQHIDNGAMIVCDDLYQRDEAVQFLIDIGYEIGDATKEWIDSNPGDKRYMNPGLSERRNKITIFAASVRKPIIAFSDIEELITQNDTQIDERSNAEFLDAFAELMS